MTKIENHVTVTPSLLAQLITECFQHKVMPMVWGMPGIGKSDIMQQIADENNLLLIDVRLTTCDITDLNGFPDNSGVKATYKVFDTFPVKGDPLPKGYDGWLVFLDELPSVNGTMQASAYKLILDRLVGQHGLHERCLLAAAGNDVNHGAVSYGMGTAAGTRMAHFNLVSDLEEWVNYGHKNGVDHRLLSFVQYRPALFHNYVADSTDKTYPNPRTWTRTSPFVKGRKELTLEYHYPLVASMVGQGAAHEFIIYSEVYKDLVGYQEIITDPEQARLPQQPANTFALTGVIIENTKQAHIDKVIIYTKRLPFEFQVITMRGLITRYPELAENKTFSKWMTDILVRIS